MGFFHKLLIRALFGKEMLAWVTAEDEFLKVFGSEDDLDVSFNNRKKTNERFKSQSV